MNRYPVWKYIIIVVAILLGALYTAPNYFGESPALQVTSGKSTVKMTSDMVARVTEALKKENIPNEGISYDGTGTYTSVRARFATPDIQFKAKSVLEKDLNTDANDPTYLVALNLQANTPQWMQSLHALPMYLGLDLRGGALPDAGRHQGRADQARTGRAGRDPQPAARQKHPPRRYRPRRRHAGNQIPRRRHAPAGQERDVRFDGRLPVHRQRRRRRPENGGQPEADIDQGNHRPGGQAEHRHAVQARQ